MICSLQFVRFCFNLSGGSCSPLIRNMIATAPYRMLYSDLMTPPCSATSVFVDVTKRLAYSYFTTPPLIQLPGVNPIQKRREHHRRCQRKKKKMEKRKLTWEKASKHTCHAESNEQPLRRHKLDSLPNPHQSFVLLPITPVRRRLHCRHRRR